MNIIKEIHLQAQNKLLTTSLKKNKKEKEGDLKSYLQMFCKQIWI